MNDWVFWIGLALLVVGAWWSMVEGQENINWFVTAGVMLWMAATTITAVTDAYANLAAVTP